MLRNRKFSFCVFFPVVLLSLMLSCCTVKPGSPASGSSEKNNKQQTEPISESRLMLDTFCTITIYDPQNRAILKDALDLCEEYEALFSISAEGSDVWRINNAGGAPVDVSPQTADIIRAGIEYAELSGGMFDITIGRLSTLWDFSGQSGLPSESDIADARATVDYHQITIADNTVQLSNPESWIDLGGIAKGYIADRAAYFLRESGVTGAVIDLGGNIVIVGRKTDGSSWRVGVTKPFSDRDDLIGIVETSEASVVSAGVYERQFVKDGVLYHHILDPTTGMPVRSDVVGATVMSEGSMEGDALSTSILLLGSVGAAAVLDESPGFIGAVLILDDGEILQYGNIEFQYLPG